MELESVFDLIGISVNPVSLHLNQWTIQNSGTSTTEVVSKASVIPMVTQDLYRHV